ncbi:hypothetical protein DOY81_006325 [Sarcophaga bullata]|nr:hypothetical protein DOY81_006325 [Sarcophaga bullata]
MDGTPKIKRKSSLSLSTRLNQKRHSASPQNRLKSSTSSSAANTRELNANLDVLQRSPSVISICSDGGIECTPPHKKIMMNLDDSLEYSPKVFDSSFSPTCLLSQTLAIESPEVGWKWNRHSSKRDDKYGFEDNSTRTPDSAYAADSSFTSVSSSSRELASNARSRRDSYKERLERQFRKYEKAKADEKLKERCAKLQEQLESAGSQKTSLKSNTESLEKNFKNNTKTTSVHLHSLPDVTSKSDSVSSESTRTPDVKMLSPEKHKKIEIMNDFFNDSDSDCLLLAATQEIESKMNVKTQPAFVNIKSTSTQSTTFSESLSLPHASTAPAATTTPPIPVTPPITPSCSSSAKKDKRSSFYMKFLEDDCPDDWFVSLDEAILQATQTTKPRTSLQRYKSLPAETITKPSGSSQVKDGNANFIMDSISNVSKKRTTTSDDTFSCSSSLSRMKRHSSTHTLSPASSSSSYRSRRQLKINANNNHNNS